MHVIEYICIGRSTLNMNTVYKRKDILFSFIIRLYHILENNFARIMEVGFNPGFIVLRTKTHSRIKTY